MLIQAEIPALIILTIKYKFSLEPNVYNNKALGNFQTENRKGDKLRAKNIASSIGSDAFFFLLDVDHGGHFCIYMYLAKNQNNSIMFYH